jgi:hypothetical protein
MPGDGASLPVVYMTVGDIIIEGANRSPQEIAKAVDQELRRQSMARTGTPDWLPTRR